MTARATTAPPADPHRVGLAEQLVQAARCVQAGLRECPGMPLAESLALARWLDDARRAVGVNYPFD